MWSLLWFVAINEIGWKNSFNSTTTELTASSLNSGLSINRSWGSEQPRLLRTTAGSSTTSGISFEWSEVPMRQVIDGLSRTYLIGERQIPEADFKTGYNMGDNEIGCIGFNNDNYCKTGRLAGDEISSNSRHIETVTSPMPCKVIALALPTTTVGRAMCDGIVQTISYDIDWRIHRDAGKRMDSNLDDRPSRRPSPNCPTRGSSPF